MSLPRRPVKLSDVAEAAGVAPMTVSRVINSPGQVSTTTAARVRAAIDRLGYVPNMLAGGLSSRRSRIVAAIVPTVASPIFAPSLAAFTDTLDAAGYHVALALSGYDPVKEEALLAALLGRRPDGLMLTGLDHTPGTRRRIRTAGVPVVEIWDLTPDPADMVVGFDHHAVGAAVGEYMLGMGLRRFAVVSAVDPRAASRRAGFVDALPPGSLCLDHRVPAPGGMRAGRDAVAALEAAGERIGLFCSSDLGAAGAVVEAGLRGIAVPGDLVVCGFGDLEVARAMEPAVSTVSVDGTEIGRRAADNLLLRLRGETAMRSVAVPFRIIERGSSRNLTQPG